MILPVLVLGVFCVNLGWSQPVTEQQRGSRIDNTSAIDKIANVVDKLRDESAVSGNIREEPTVNEVAKKEPTRDSRHVSEKQNAEAFDEKLLNDRQDLSNEIYTADTNLDQGKDQTMGRQSTDVMPMTSDEPENSDDLDVPRPKKKLTIPRKAVESDKFVPAVTTTPEENIPQNTKPDTFKNPREIEPVTLTETISTTPKLDTFEVFINVADLTSGGKRPTRGKDDKSDTLLNDVIATSEQQLLVSVTPQNIEIDVTEDLQIPKVPIENKPEALSEDADLTTEKFDVTERLQVPKVPIENQPNALSKDADLTTKKFDERLQIPKVPLEKKPEMPSLDVALTQEKKSPVPLGPKIHDKLVSDVTVTSTEKPKSVDTFDKVKVMTPERTTTSGPSLGNDEKVRNDMRSTSQETDDKLSRSSGSAERVDNNVTDSTEENLIATGRKIAAKLKDPRACNDPDVAKYIAANPNRSGNDFDYLDKSVINNFPNEGSSRPPGESTTALKQTKSEESPLSLPLVPGMDKSEDSDEASVEETHHDVSVVININPQHEEEPAEKRIPLENDIMQRIFGYPSSRQQNRLPPTNPWFTGQQTENDLMRQSSHESERSVSPFLKLIRSLVNTPRQNDKLLDHLRHCSLMSSTNRQPYRRYNKNRKPARKSDNAWHPEATVVHTFPSLDSLVDRPDKAEASEASEPVQHELEITFVGPSAELELPASFHKGSHQSDSESDLRSVGQDDHLMSSPPFEFHLPSMFHRDLRQGSPKGGLGLAEQDNPHVSSSPFDFDGKDTASGAAHFSRVHGPAALFSEAKFPTPGSFPGQVLREALNKLQQAGTNGHRHNCSINGGGSLMPDTRKADVANPSMLSGFGHNRNLFPATRTADVSNPTMLSALLSPLDNSESSDSGETSDGSWQFNSFKSSPSSSEPSDEIVPAAKLSKLVSGNGFSDPEETGKNSAKLRGEPGSRPAHTDDAVTAGVEESAKRSDQATESTLEIQTSLGQHSSFLFSFLKDPFSFVHSSFHNSPGLPDATQPFKQLPTSSKPAGAIGSSQSDVFSKSLPGQPFPSFTGDNSRPDSDSPKMSPVGSLGSGVGDSVKSNERSKLPDKGNVDGWVQMHSGDSVQSSEHQTNSDSSFNSKESPSSDSVEQSEAFGVPKSPTISEDEASPKQRSKSATSFGSSDGSKSADSSDEGRSSSAEELVSESDLSSSFGVMDALDQIFNDEDTEHSSQHFEDPGAFEEREDDQDVWDEF
ncbi:hypothetical protein V1264_016185 [Littorina saxatilis]|uniref:Uncharacterized protein n=1 Tax=Littorina saxatilis TaxID=31220 RepID=A0AAN9BMX2_9CAEN